MQAQASAAAQHASWEQLRQPRKDVTRSDGQAHALREGEVEAAPQHGQHGQHGGVRKVLAQAVTWPAPEGQVARGDRLLACTIRWR